MTRKHYQATATAFGAALRGLGDNIDQRAGAWHAMTAWMDVAAADNPKFDRERFTEWVRQVMDLERDLDGKKVA